MMQWAPEFLHTIPEAFSDVLNSLYMHFLTDSINIQIRCFSFFLPRITQLFVSLVPFSVNHLADV